MHNPPPLPPSFRSPPPSQPPGLHKNEVALTHAEARAHFAAWAIVSSPLVLGLDLTNASLVDSVWDIIANEEAIAVNQAWAGGSGTLLQRDASNVTWAPCGIWPSCSAGTWEIWSKPLPGGRAAVLLLNHGAGASPPVVLQLASVPGLTQCGSAGQPCAVRDLYAHAFVSNTTVGSFTFSPLSSHDSAFLVFSAA